MIQNLFDEVWTAITHKFSKDQDENLRDTDDRDHEIHEEMFSNLATWSDKHALIGECRDENSKILATTRNNPP